jgi:hypothetical protein
MCLAPSSLPADAAAHYAARRESLISDLNSILGSGLVKGLGCGRITGAEYM